MEGGSLEKKGTTSVQDSIPLTVLVKLFYNLAYIKADDCWNVFKHGYKNTKKKKSMFPQIQVLIIAFLNSY